MLSRAPFWLDVTPQQFDILLAVYNLQLSGGRVSPKRILERYSSDSGRFLQRSNLFAQLRVLLERGFLVKESDANYLLNFDGLESYLSSRRESLVSDLEEFDRLSSDVRSFFRRVVLSELRPRVFYMGFGECLDSMLKSVSSCSVLYATSFFPTVSYSFQLASGVGRREYFEVLCGRCLEKSELQVNYLTPLDVDFLFNHAFRVLGDPRKAYRESLIVLEELANQVETFDSLDVRFLRDLQGMDVFVPVKGDVVSEFLLFTRDEHRDLTGAIYINSKDIAASMRQSFVRNFDYAERIRGSKGEEIIEDAKHRLEEKYNV